MAVSEEIQRQVLEEAISVTPNYDIDYSDERFGKVESDKNQALTELEQTYGGMINNADKYYEDQIQASKDWADKQSQIQQENTDFAIEKIEQQKDQANKDYLKEQSGAYTDWQKQSNKYGVEAEKMASAGLANSGFSESSQVSMYNTYQNRVATARESYTKAVLNYDNAIKDAQLQNNAALAEIAYQSLQQQLELSLQGFQYKNQLILEQANKKTELENVYYNRYQDVLQQMNTENALKEEIRQYTDSQKWQTEQNELNRQHELERDEINNKFQAAQNEINREFEAAQAELDRKHDKELLQAKSEIERKAAEEAHKRDMEKLKQQQAYALEQIAAEQKNALAKLDKQLANDKALASYTNSLSKSSSSSSGGSSKISSSSSSGSSGSISKTYAVNTAYYQGAKNSDASKYGTFSNGYQPKGISGHGTLSKTGKTITIKTQTLSGQKQTVVQNVWKAEDGTTWYWEGRQNKYIQIK